MSGPHTRAAATATRLITKHGRAISLVTPGANSGSSFDPSFGAETVVSVVGVALDVEANEVDGTVVRAHDRKYLFDGEYAIETDMVIRDGAINYTVRRAVPFTPGTTRVITTVFAGL